MDFIKNVLEYFLHFVVVVCIIYWIFSTSSKEKSDSIKNQIKDFKGVFTKYDEEKIREIYKEKERSKKKSSEEKKEK